MAVVPTTWDPANAGSATLSGGNLTATASGSAFNMTRTLASASSGKYYMEFSGFNGNTQLPGINLSTGVFSTFPGFLANSGYGYFGADGKKYVNGTNSAYGATFTTGDVISLLLDLDNGTLIFWKNGVSQGTLASGLSGTYFVVWSDGTSANGATITANFGASAFTYTPPAGYEAGFGAIAGVGSAVGSGVATGVGASRFAGVGSSAGVGTASGTGTAIRSGDAASSGAGIATGVGRSTNEAVGSSSGTSAASAVGEDGGAIADGAGAAAGTGTAAATGESTAAATAASAGTGTATGVASATAASVAASTGQATAAATGDAVINYQAGDGAAAGSATAAASAASTASATAAATGTGAATGVGIWTAAAAGQAAGAASATGASDVAIIIDAVGSAQGMADVLGFGQAAGQRIIVDSLIVSGAITRSPTIVLNVTRAKPTLGQVTR